VTTDFDLLTLDHCMVLNVGYGTDSLNSCQFWCFCDFLLSNFGQTSSRLADSMILLP